MEMDRCDNFHVLEALGVCLSRIRSLRVWVLHLLQIQLVQSLNISWHALDTPDGLSWSDEWDGGEEFVVGRCGGEDEVIDEVSDLSQKC